MTLTPSSWRPAHLGWRVAQTFVDDLMVLGVTLSIASLAGLLSGDVHWPDLRIIKAGDLHMVASELRQFLTIIPVVGLLFVIYWTIKLLYQTAFLALCRGRTPGCLVLALRVVRKDGTPVGWREAAARTIAGGILANVPVIGQVLRFIDYLATLFNKRRMALRDIAAGTMLVHAQPILSEAANG